MITDRGVRNLAQLQQHASTARLLNLRAIWQSSKDEPEYSSKPFFQNARLNRTLILKHSLRRDELYLFHRPRATATKIIFPVDPKDLKLGGHFVFVGQANFDSHLVDMLGDNAESVSKADIALLHLLDALPSLDPFLLREELRRKGYHPAPCYLRLSQADIDRIFAFVQSEIEPLVRLALGGGSDGSHRTSRLVEKILSNTIDSEMQPLRKVLGLSEDAFAEGLFCWKGYLYYKWVYKGVEAAAPKVIAAIEHIKPSGQLDLQTRVLLGRLSTTVVERVVSSQKSVRAFLDVYDDAQRDLTHNSKAVALRDFLLNAPTLFSELGARIGALQHIINFWSFRFPNNQPAHVAVGELHEIFNDFDATLFMNTRERELLPT